MLSYAELPSIYVQIDTGLLCVFDHLEAQMLDCEGTQKKLSIYNPTQFDAKVSVFAENSYNTNVPIGQNFMSALECLDVPSRQTVEVFYPTSRIVEETCSAMSSNVTREVCEQV